MGSRLALSASLRSAALPKGEPLAKRETLPYCQSLSLWERWHCISNDGEGEDACRYDSYNTFSINTTYRRTPK